MTTVSTDSVAARVRSLGLACVDAVAYALVVALATTAGALALGIATGGGFARAKAALFLAGFAMMAYATVRLWPTSPEDLERDGARGNGYGSAVSAPGGDRTRFQSFVRALPPVRWLRLPPVDRCFSHGGKVFLGSLFVLFASYLMEVGFGIA